MVRAKSDGIPRPTNAELGILRVLWDLGPSTVRSVHDTLLAEKENLGYTTVLKFLQIMHRKGLVKRDDWERAHVYAPTVSRFETQQQLTSFLVDNVFDGSRSQLVLQALGNGDVADSKELDEIKALLRRLEERKP
jgi:BlaI family transcriptional regulator, penicillinase repressor